MRSLYPNLLSLTEWTQYMGLDPWRVAGFCNTPRPYDLSQAGECCEGVWSEFSYQHNQLARTDVSQAIMAAEELFSSAIGYWPAPKAIAREPRNYPWGDNILSNMGMINKKGGFKSVRLRYAHALALGVETLTLIDTVSITPTYAMGYTAGQEDAAVPDHFTFDVLLPDGMTPDEIRIFYAADDRLNEPREEWEIRPLSISMSGQTATVQGDAWLFGKPKLLIDAQARCLSATDIEGSYVAQVEVWRCHFDGSQHGNFVWEDAGCADAPCNETRQSFCASVRVEPCSYVVPRPATYDEDTQAFKWTTACPPAPPRRIEVNYKSGILPSNYRMERRHGRVIALLAASLLDCSICACGCTKERLNKYSHYEMAMKDEGIGGVKTYERIKNARTSENPFGERYGQLQAWMQARNWVICN